MKRPTYTVREGFRLPEPVAAETMKLWVRLERELDHPPTADEFLAAAARAKGPVHDYFEWDDATAATEYRLTQARYLLRAIEVHMPDFGDAVVRAILPVNGGFVSTRKAMVEDRSVVLAQLRRLQREAARLTEEYAAWSRLIEFEPARPFLNAAARLAALPV